MSGGVSSDIWRVELPENKMICVKRALAKLKVEADWRAPVERNNSEWEWFNFVYKNFPEIVPKPLAHDREMQMLAMEFLAPEKFKIWKNELLEGNIDPGFAAKAGKFLGKIHTKSANDEKIRRIFQTDEFFFALRIEPYMLATAKKHLDISDKIEKIAEQTFNTKFALVHGDVSPKNILIGKENPVFLDAETAWFGDPAFDLAFCLNHFLLKSVFLRESAAEFIECFRNFAANYLSEITWEKSKSLEKRAAQILPVLLLARIDGKSPVEYLTNLEDKDFVRNLARKFIQNPTKNLAEIANEFLD